MGQSGKVGILGALLLVLVVFAVPGLCGTLNDPALPNSAGSAMHTLTGIYNRLTTNATETKRSGGFTEPSSGPGSTGFTLDQVYDKALPTQVGRTGQTTS